MFILHDLKGRNKQILFSVTVGRLLKRPRYFRAGCRRGWWRRPGRGCGVGFGSGRGGPRRAVADLVGGAVSQEFQGEVAFGDDLGIEVFQRFLERAVVSAGGGGKGFEPGGFDGVDSAGFEELSAMAADVIAAEGPQAADMVGGFAGEGDNRLVEK